MADWQTGKSSTEANYHMLTDGIGTDITFMFTGDESGEAVEVAAHKNLLIARSCIFEAMFCGSLRETGKHVNITDIEPNIFKDMLKFIYTDSTDMTQDNALPLLYAANKYQVSLLVEECWKFLEKNLNSENLALIMDQAIFYGKDTLVKKCHQFLTYSVQDSTKCLKQHHISSECLKCILEQDDSLCEEIDLFLYCNHWAEVECGKQGFEKTGLKKRQVLGKLLYLLRLPVISATDLSSRVSPTGLLTEKEEVNLYKYMNGITSVDMPFPTSKRSALFKVTRVGKKTIVIECREDWQLMGLIYDPDETNIPRFSDLRHTFGDPLILDAEDETTIAWKHPYDVVANRKMYIEIRGEMFCVNILYDNLQEIQEEEDLTFLVKDFSKLKRRRFGDLGKSITLRGIVYRHRVK